ncbi:uncharacterized protein LOC128990755 [Macrosteles quadrilineatus]|uniref:uncharacterized protein LOC128990755 n=1 Tax=Macrosteles quadrilineatus TaxID=74068 RepID=UPI0023E1D553|nr:uncharacterized protein LOC128990755 [Macrosteles quadrilineatus]
MPAHLVVTVIIILAAVQGYYCNRDEEALQWYHKVQRLYKETEPSFMGCWGFWKSNEKVEACHEEVRKKKYELMLEVRKGWLEKQYLPSVDDMPCTKGYAWFNIGLFDDPAKLPCDEKAFEKPKFTEDQIETKYRELKQLWRDYEAMCYSNCEEQERTRGLILAEALKKAVEEGYIDDNCTPEGFGTWSFDSGMPETDMPCIPMQKETKDGGSGTKKSS